MHEIAHIICEHDADTFQQVGSFPFMLRTYNSEQEGEAEWLGAALQLPRVALSWAKRSRMDYTAIAEHFGCSLEIARYRCNVTGVNKQFSL